MHFGGPKSAPDRPKSLKWHTISAWKCEFLHFLRIWRALQRLKRVPIPENLNYNAFLMEFHAFRGPEKCPGSSKIIEMTHYFCVEVCISSFLRIWRALQRLKRAPIPENLDYNAFLMVFRALECAPKWRNNGNPLNSLHFYETKCVRLAKKAPFGRACTFEKRQQRKMYEIQGLGDVF